MEPWQAEIARRVVDTPCEPGVINVVVGKANPAGLLAHLGSAAVAFSALTRGGVAAPLFATWQTGLRPAAVFFDATTLPRSRDKQTAFWSVVGYASRGSVVCKRGRVDVVPCQVWVFAAKVPKAIPDCRRRVFVVTNGALVQSAAGDAIPLAAFV